MAKLLAIVISVCSLAGCYNPRYPSETPGPRAIPQETGNSQETSVRQTNRRDSSAGSGSSVSGY